MRRPLLAFAALLLVGCGSTLSPEPPTTLDAARAAWAARGATNYDFTILKQCFCPAEMAGPFVVEVRGESRRITRNGTEVEARWLEGLPTDAAALFAFVAERETQQDFRATYDPTSGFVLSVWSDPIPEAVDDELGLSIGDLVIRK